MSYKIIISPKAQNEIEESYDFYSGRTKFSATNFISSLTETYNILSLHPHFQFAYENIRAVKIKKYPFALYFVIDESTSIVRILACFHTSRNPLNRP